jgi:uncharacterized protein (DUF885 family)
MTAIHEEATLRRRIEEYWTSFLRQYPVWATGIGDSRFDDRLPDPSDDGVSERESINASFLNDLEAVDRSDLDYDTRVTVDLLQALARRELDVVRYRFDRFWAASHLVGSYFLGPARLLSQLGSLQRVQDAESLERYLSRLRAIPRYFAGISELLHAAAAEGQLLPRVVVNRTIALLERQLEAGPETSPALEPIANGDSAARETVRQLLDDVAFPSLQGYLAALQKYRFSARETIGLLALPDGDEMYAAEVRGWTSLELDPREVHELGVRELDKIREERDGVAAANGFRDSAAFLIARREARGDEFQSREAILSLVTKQVERAWDALPRFFGHLPKENCQIRPIEEFMESSTPDYYQGGTPDGGRRGTYFVNTSSRYLHSVAAITYHETNPGHHLQISLDMERPSGFEARRQGTELQGAAFGEGWGLYSERLADEMELYEDDFERLGMLEMQAARATRLIVDTGIHAFGWNRRQVVEALLDAGVNAPIAESEADRYIAAPGQALCYKIGQMEIEGWRADAARRPDQSFSLSRFHDAVLSLGSLPLPVMRRELEALEL